MIDSYMTETVEFSKPVRSRTTDGGYEIVYESAGSVKGRKVRVAGRETEAGGKIVNLYDEFIYCEYAEIKEDYKITYQNKIYKILGIIESPEEFRTFDKFLKIEIKYDKD